LPHYSVELLVAVGKFDPSTWLLTETEHLPYHSTFGSYRTLCLKGELSGMREWSMEGGVCWREISVDYPCETILLDECCMFHVSVFEPPLGLTDDP
jgi:hypothetical protein